NLGTPIRNSELCQQIRRIEGLCTVVDRRRLERVGYDIALRVLDSDVTRIRLARIADADIRIPDIDAAGRAGRIGLDSVQMKVAPAVDRNRLHKMNGLLPEVDLLLVY